MPFNPSVGETLRIDTTIYRIAAHPAVPDMPYGQSGRKATVYALDADTGGRRALKVFTPAFRSAQVVNQSAQLRALADLPGMAVFNRVALNAEHHAGVLKRFPDLEYAVLMPWAAGETWQELVLDQRALTASQCRGLAAALAEVLAALEARGIAHCDLSGANLILCLDTLQVTLVDVEDLYAPGIARPARLPAGSPGYAHRSAARGLWQPAADRFAGALLLSEILAWQLPAVRAQAEGESFFAPGELQRDRLRAQLMADTLRRHAASELAGLFARAWASRSLEECPTLGEWAAALGAARPASIARAVGEAAKPQPEPAPAPPAGLSLAEADAQVASYAEAYRVAPGIVAISYSRALQRRGLLHEHAGAARAALADYQAAQAVAPAGSLADELRVAAERVAPLAASVPAPTPIAAPAPTVRRPANLPAPPRSQQPMQMLAGISTALPATLVAQPVAGIARERSAWPSQLRPSSRGAMLRALILAALILAAAVFAAGIALAGDLSRLERALLAYGIVGPEACAAAGLGAICGLLYALVFRSRLHIGQGLVLVLLAAGGAALGGVAASGWIMRLLSLPALYGAVSGGIEGGVAGLILGAGLSSMLRGRSWATHGMLGWGAAWAVAFGGSQWLIPALGPVITPALGWAVALTGIALTLTAALHHATEVEV